MQKLLFIRQTVDREKQKPRLDPQDRDEEPHNPFDLKHFQKEQTGEVNEVVNYFEI